MIKIIDVRNVPCPGPVIEAKKALKEMEEGTLEVWVDNHIAVLNLTKLSTYLKLDAISEQLEDGSYKVLFQIGQEPRADIIKNSSKESVKENRIPDGRNNSAVVVLSSECMGDGDEILGRLLMKGFLYALTELEQLPEAVLLYNGGAKLSTEGSESLQDLMLLESQGVEIMTCGTCLNHYGLSERLRVGTVTNMYSIAEKLMGAGSVVKP